MSSGRRGDANANPGQIAAARSESVRQGVQPGFETFIPARAALLRCQMWPNTLDFHSFVQPNVEVADTTALCAELDASLVTAFQNQPFMKGFTPKLVDQLLEKSAQPQFLHEFSETLAKRSGKSERCSTCESVLDYYQRSIAERQDWRQALGQVSSLVRHADAVVLPFVVTAHQEILDDRGLVVAKRTAEVAVIMVDPADGSLIWGSTRTALAVRQAYKNPAQQGFGKNALPAFAAWQEVSQQLFTDSLWRGYPGRQILE